MRNVLITGANRGLGRYVAQTLLEQHGDAINQLILTCRQEAPSDISADTKIHWRALDLAASHHHFDVHSLPALDVVLHCASPYQTTSLMKASVEEMQFNARVLSNEMLLLQQLAQHLNEQGKLIISGSVSSERIDEINSVLAENVGNIGNAGGCTLHAVHKGAVRDFTACLYQENPQLKIIHANISGFVDTPSKSEEGELLSTEYVSSQLVNCMLSDESKIPFNIDIVSNKVAESLRIVRAHHCNHILGMDSDDVDAGNHSQFFSNLK